jgi:hypothetical protein
VTGDPGGWLSRVGPESTRTARAVLRLRRMIRDAASSKLGGQLVEHPAHAVALDVLDGLSVDARCATVTAYLVPRPLQNVSARDLGIERVEASSGLSLGDPVAALPSPTVVPKGSAVAVNRHANTRWGASGSHTTAGSLSAAPGVP